MIKFETVVTVRWGDMDALGHVNNAVYFSYMEQARIDWLATMQDKLDLKGQGPILATARCQYHKPLHYPADLRIRLSNEPPGNRSFLLRYAMFLEDESLVAEGETVIVWMDFSQGKAVPLPQPLRVVLE